MKYLLLYLTLLLAGCNTSSETGPVEDDSANVDGTLIEDTARISVDTAAPSATTGHSNLPAGIYQAVLPCPDCKGIEHIVAFYPNNTFRLQETRWKENPEVTTTTGTWKPTSGIIHLYHNHLMVGRYRWQQDSLYYLQGNRQYVLNKHPSARENTVWARKKAEGLEFFGVGNEPFWSVSVNKQHAISFQLADWEKPVHFTSAQPVVSADSILYHSTNDSAQLRLVVYHRFCSDGMSDFIYDETVTVHYNGTTYKGCGLRYN